VFSVNASGYVNIEAKKPEAKDASGEEQKAELSKSERFSKAALGATLHFDTGGKNIVQPESGQKLDEKPKADSQSAERVPKRMGIVLPESERGEVRVKLQAAPSPIVISEINYNDPATGLPAQKPADVGLAKEEVGLRVSTIEPAIPKSGLVEVVDAAEAQPAKNLSLWERVRGVVDGDVERSVRISVQKDVSDIAGLGGERSYHGFDPYWVQTESEVIQSKAVLEKVVEKLNLNEAWAKTHGGGDKLQTEETLRLLKKKIDVRSDPKSGLIDIRAKSDSPDEAALLANTIAQVYRDSRLQRHDEMSARGRQVLEAALVEQGREIARIEQVLERRKRELNPRQNDEPLPKLAAGAPVPQPEVATTDNAFSTFSLNVSDVSFKLAAASLEKGQMPDPAAVRGEEFINAFDYRDPEPTGSAPIAFAWERARYPFAHDRDLLRFSVKTAASGRQPGRPLNLVLLLDNSGSMERADRVRIRQECLRVLAGQLQPQDRVSVVAFARTARLWVDGLPGNQASELSQRVGGLAPEGGTNLEDAMNVAYQTALRHFLANGVNRVVLLTDGAANLGDVEPESLKKKVETYRRQGVALDCFGIGWDGLNDELLEALSRNGDGRYGFVNTPEAAATEFAGQLAGALKVQVEWNPRRVTAYRQIGYAKHQLKKEQFRDNTVDAAEIGAAEAGNALYIVQVNPRGEGPLGTMRVRFKVPGTSDYREHEWAVPYEGSAKSLEQSSSALRLAASASAFSEWLVSSPFAAEVTPDKLLAHLSGVSEAFPADPRPKKLEWMIRQAKSVAGK
jgi:Mg-chelatase subunit ChlD